MTEILTDRQVATILKLNNPTSWKTVQKLARSGKIKGRKIGNQWRFHPEAVEDFLLMTEARESL